MELDAIKNAEIRIMLKETKELINSNKIDMALFNIRKTLENLLIFYSKQANLPTSQDEMDIDMSAMIDNLKKYDLINESIASDLHRIRKLGNKGVHVTNEPLFIDDAKEAYELIVNVIPRLDEFCDISQIYRISQNLNEPMHNPNYYSPMRRYYGKWNHCYTREQLLQIPEYIELEKRANSGDISAMLDIAVGFLARDINWSNQGLVCMPPYKFNDMFFSNKTAYDARYYYWIYRATDAVLQYFNNNNSNLYNGVIPLKYISTSLIEMFKFYFFTLDYQYYYVTYVNNEKPVYTDQYKTAKSMFGEINLNDFDLYASLEILITLIEKYGSDIITANHKENTPLRVKYLCYICSYLYQRNNGTSFWSDCKNRKFIISKEDTNDNEVTISILKKYTYDALCNYYFSLVLEKEENEKIVKILEEEPKKKGSYFLIIILFFIIALFILFRSESTTANISYLIVFIGVLILSLITRKRRKINAAEIVNFILKGDN